MCIHYITKYIHICEYIIINKSSTYKVNKIYTHVYRFQYTSLQARSLVVMFDINLLCPTLMYYSMSQESCLTSMSHGHQRVMSHINWHQRVMSYINESLTSMSHWHHWVISVIHLVCLTSIIQESCLTSTSHVLHQRVIDIIESCLTSIVRVSHERVLSMSHISHPWFTSLVHDSQCLGPK